MAKNKTSKTSKTNKTNKTKSSAINPLYAVAGAYEVAFEFARGYAVEAQKNATKRYNNVQKQLGKIEREPKALQDQAVSVVNERVEELQKEAKDAQSKFETRVNELQDEAKALPKKLQTEIDDAVTELAKTYADLVDRGEKIVTAIRKDGVKALTTVRSAPNKSSLVRRERAKVAADKPKNSSRPVKKSATKKPVAKKTPAKTTAKKATAAKKTATDTAKAPVKTAKTTAKSTAETAKSTANKAANTAADATS